MVRAKSSLTGVRRMRNDGEPIFLNETVLFRSILSDPPGGDGVYGTRLRIGGFKYVRQIFNFIFERNGQYKYKEKKRYNINSTAIIKVGTKRKKCW